MGELTKAQRIILANVREGRRIDYGKAAGRSAAVGWYRSMRSCRLAGWLDKDWQITPAGRAVLEQKP